MLKKLFIEKPKAVLSEIKYEFTINKEIKSTIKSLKEENEKQRIWLKSLPAKHAAYEQSVRDLEKRAAELKAERVTPTQEPDCELQMRAGDHLWVQRLGYQHHGLASGPYTVIQYSGKDGIFETGIIEEVPLSTFASGKAVQKIDHPRRLHSRSASVQRARERIGEEKYNLVFNNCEHFVMWCIEDSHTSAQVNQRIRAVGHVAAAAWISPSAVTMVTASRIDLTSVTTGRVAAPSVRSVLMDAASNATGLGIAVKLWRKLTD
ncbi:lecithin retinol acyltransferase family protein [Cupriavidus pauculus]|uniref:lecithin retinol acyltransferase family protein n=1 Tax=Cupriavidus pauculus TaxID=82633 RepID=UPI000AA8CBC4|nr:lecithin retinol acyltransferase family protein [Cupriavidus pauculus]